MIQFHVREIARKVNPPLVNNQQVTDVQVGSEDQTNDEHAIRYDRRRRRRVQSKGVKHEIPDIIE